MIITRWIIEMRMLQRLRIANGSKTTKALATSGSRDDGGGRVDDDVGW